MPEITLTEFIKKHGITVESEWAKDNPNFHDEPGASTYRVRFDHWKVTLRCKERSRQLTIYFSMGEGHNGKEPTAEDVLSCIASDSASVESADNFERWAWELGYDLDSRKAEKTYNVCVKQAEKTKKFLGEELYKDLLWNVEPY